MNRLLATALLLGCAGTEGDLTAPVTGRPPTVTPPPSCSVATQIDASCIAAADRKALANRACVTSQTQLQNLTYLEVCGTERYQGIRYVCCPPDLQATCTAKTLSDGTCRSEETLRPLLLRACNMVDLPSVQGVLLSDGCGSSMYRKVDFLCCPITLNM